MQNSPLMHLESAPFATDFDRRPFKIRHELCDHPLFQLPRLIQLARSLDTPILYFRGNHSINQVDEPHSERAGQKRTFMERGLSRPELSAEFLRVKRQEWVRYHSAVGRWETDQYLTLF